MIRTFIRGVLATLALVTLASCGGGSNTCVDVAGGNACAATPDPTAVVSKLSLSLSAATINNSGSETIVATVTATNTNNQTMADVPVVLSVDADAEIAVVGSVTDGNGSLTGTVRIGENRDNRVVIVTATANNGSLRTTRTFQVVGAELTATLVPGVISPGAAGQVQYRLLDSNSNPMVGSTISVTGPGGVQSEGTTGLNGQFTYAYTAPTTTGDLAITAQGGGASLVSTVLVQPAGGGSIPAVNPSVTPVISASVSANPSVVPVNSATTDNQSQIRVLFLTNNNAPIQNMRVRFDLAGDASSIGGEFTTGDNIVYSNANGVATSAYRPGTRSGPTDGLTIRACWDYVDFTTCDPAKSVTTTLTIVDDPVSVTIGTNALIETGTSGLTYVKRYVVQVVDSSGVAKPDVQISPSVDLTKFYKGIWFPTLENWVQSIQATCDNEDLNRNNTSETYADGWVEDANGSFNLTPGRPALEPRKADVAVSFEGSSRTDSSGIVILRLEYPQNLGSWVDFNLTVAASGVSATEGRANFSGRLPVPADAVDNPDEAPAFDLSPYGVEASALLPKTFNGITYQLCTNPN
jgi:hypothetical protein